MAHYVDAQNGDDGGPGTEEAPWLTLGELVNQGTFDDNTVYLSGHFRENLSISQASSLSIEQWPGQAQAIIDGGVVVTNDTWNADGGAHYSEDPGNAQNIKGVTVAWEASVGVNRAGCPYHFGTLTAASSRANCQATDNSWYYDTSTTPDRLYVRIGANEDPTTHVVEWCKGGLSGINISAATGGRIRFYGLQVQRWMDGTGAYYGIQVAGVNGATEIEFDSCVGFDCGNKTFGSLGAAAVPMVKFDNCICAGLANNGTHLVAYSTVTSTGVRIRGCKFDRRSHRSRTAGTPALAGASVQSIVVHTDATDTFYSDVECTDCADDGGFEAGTPFRFDNPVLNTTALDNFSTYSARVERFTSYGSYGIGFADGAGGGNQTAIRNCKLHFGGGSMGANTTLINGSGDSSEKYVLLEGNQFILDLDGAGASFAIRMRGIDAGAFDTAQLRMYNNSFVDVGSGTNDRYMVLVFEAVTAIAHYKGRGNIYAFKNANAATRVFMGNDTWNQTNTPRDFDGNLYFGVVATAYSSNSSYNASTEWVPVIDATGVVLSTFPFRNLTDDDSTAGDVSLIAAEIIRRRRQTLHTNRGVNLAPYGGNYGAWQYGGPAAAMKAGIIGGITDDDTIDEEE